MKLTRHFAAALTLALLAAALAGCHLGHSSTNPVSNGFEEVTHPEHTWAVMDEPKPPRLALQYRATNDVITPIWPSLYSPGEIIRGKLAVFVAERAYIEEQPVTHPRLFVVKVPGLPLDITDEVLRRWARANNRVFSAARDRLGLITPEDNDDQVDLRLDFIVRDSWISRREDWPDQGTFQLTWPQIDQIMQLMKTNGVEKKDLRWQTPFIGESR